MDQIKLLIRQLGTFPGHKTVLLLSPGFTTNGEPDQFQAMLNKANLADLSFYAFDANGLNETSTTQASTMAMQHVAALSSQQRTLAPGEGTTNLVMGHVGVLAESSRQDDYLHDAVRTSDSQSGLRALAEGTGGFLVANTNDLRKPFQQIADDADTHYEADYHPASAKYDGHFRKIEVKLARADWKAEKPHRLLRHTGFRRRGALAAVRNGGTHDAELQSAPARLRSALSRVSVPAGRRDIAIGRGFRVAWCEPHRDAAARAAEAPDPHRAAGGSEGC